MLQRGFVSERGFVARNSTDELRDKAGDAERALVAMQQQETLFFSAPPTHY